MSNNRLIKKEELFSKFKTGLEICFKDSSRGSIYDLNLTTINQVFYPIISKSFYDENRSEKSDYYIPLDSEQPYEPKIEYAKGILKIQNIEKFEKIANELEKLFKDFPKIKRFFYAINIGHYEKIARSRANQERLQHCKDMISGKTALPGSVTYLFPDEITVPNFIPEIDQVLYRTHYDDLNNFSIEEFQIVKIDAYDDYSHGMTDEVNNLFNHQVVYKPSYTLNFLITLQSKNDKKTISINSKDLIRFNDQSIELAYQRKLFVSRDDAASYLKNTAQTAIDNIQNSLKLI